MRVGPKNPKKDDGKSLLGFLGNVAGDVKDVAVGLFPSIWQINKTIAQGAYSATPMGWAPGGGGETARRAFRNNSQQLAEGAWDSLKQSGSNWKRVATGDFDPLYEDAAFMALDVAAIASGGSAAGVRGAKVASSVGRKRVVRAAGDKRVVQQTRGVDLSPRVARGQQVRPAWLRGAVNDIADPALSKDLTSGAGLAYGRVGRLASSTTLAARQRPAKILNRDIGLRSLEELGIDDVKLKALGNSFTMGQAAVPQRPLARTPLARAIQKPLIAGIDAMVGKSERLTGISNRRGARRMVNAADREARDAAAQRLVDAGVEDYDSAINRREFRKSPQEQVAAMLHLEGVLGARDGLSAAQARDRAVAEARENLEASKRDPDWTPEGAANRKSITGAEKQIALLESLPEELLDLSGDSPAVARVREVVSAGAKFGRNIRQYDLYNLDDLEGAGRNVRRERETLSQRLLVGGAKYMPDFKRAMVPEELDRLVRGGRRYASEAEVGEVAGRIRGKVNDQKKTPGEAAYRFLDRTDQGEAFRAATPAQQISTLQRVERRQVVDREGKLPSAEEVYSASAELRELQSRKPRDVSATTDTVSAYRIRGKDGSTSEWVRGEKGKAPEPVRRAKEDGDTIEYAEVPAATWYRNQNKSGRVDKLPGRLESGTVRTKDGRTVGVLRGTAATGATRREIPETRPDEPLNRPLPPAVAKQLRESRLSPAAQRTVVTELGYDQPKGRATNAQVAAQALIEAGHVKVSDLTRVSRREHLDRAIVDGVNALQKGRIPLDRDGRVDFDTLWTQLRTDDTLREVWNEPSLLSRTEILPSVYVRHYTLGDASRHQLLSRRGRQTTSPVGPEAGLTPTEGRLAGRLGYSLSPQMLIRTGDTITRTVSNREFLSNALDMWAVKNKNGQVLTFAADKAKDLNSDDWMVIPVAAFDKAEVWLRGWDPNDGGRKGVVLDPKDLKGSEGAVYLFPREIGMRFKYAFDNPSGFWRGYDNVMQMWRGGILALAPRWYLNNFIGNTIFYGFATGMDFASIRLATKMRDQIPFRVHAGGISSQGTDRPEVPITSDPKGANAFTRGYSRVVMRGYRINNIFEGAIRDAAYVHAMKKLLKNEGLYNKSARSKRAKGQANDIELMEAIASSPDYIKREAIREMEKWMGDYQSLGKFERDVLRRAMPFYSWIKVINTWLFGLPFRSPIRAEMLAMASAIGNELAGDRSYLPWWEQGRIDLTKGFSLRTSGMNPLASVIEPLLPLGQKGAGWQDIAPEVLASFGGQSSPAIQGLVGQLAGRKTFGDRDFTAPPGYGGSVSAYGRDPATYNKITGQIETRSNKGNLAETVFQMVPGVQQVRDLVSWGRTPYDSASTLDLVLGAVGYKGSDELYQPPAKRESGRKKVPLANYAGFPIYRVDREQEKLNDRRRKAQYRKDETYQKRLIRREAFRRENG